MQHWRVRMMIQVHGMNLPKPRFTGMKLWVQLMLAYEQKITIRHLQESADRQTQNSGGYWKRLGNNGDMRDSFCFLVLLPLIMPWQAVELLYYFLPGRDTSPN